MQASQSKQPTSEINNAVDSNESRNYYTSYWYVTISLILEKLWLFSNHTSVSSEETYVSGSANTTMTLVNTIKNLANLSDQLKATKT